MLDSIIFENLPQDMTDEQRWILWEPRRSKNRSGDWITKKVPVHPYRRNPRTDQLVECNYTDPEEYYDFESIRYDWERLSVDRRLGIGFRLGDGWMGCDLDTCISNKQFTPWAKDALRRLRSYSEVSPSGTGVKVFMRGSFPTVHTKFVLDPTIKSHAPQIEIYTDVRYFAVTGSCLVPNVPIRERTEELKQLHDELVETHYPNTKLKGVNQTTGFGGSCVENVFDDEIVKVASQVHGAKFRALWAGDLSLSGNDHSRADLALCNYLAMMTCNTPERVDRLFHCSGLMRPKWRNVKYRERTITKACTCSCLFNWSTYRNTMEGSAHEGW
jgi:putative DNA primase/helicase